MKVHLGTSQSFSKKNKNENLLCTSISFSREEFKRGYKMTNSMQSISFSREEFKRSFAPYKGDIR